MVMNTGFENQDSRMPDVEADEDMQQYSDDEEDYSQNETTESPMDEILAEFDDSKHQGVYRVHKWNETTETWRWKLENIPEAKNREISPVFHVNGEPWRILAFPRGNDTSHLSIYLDVATPEKPKGWARYAMFNLTLVNQLDYKKSISNEVEKRFGREDNDWGFRDFAKLSEIFDPSKGFYVNETLIIEATVCVRKEPHLLNPYDYNSRKETGFVGITNQGATCYLNSLLQSLYHLGYFRKALYKMPSDADKKGSNNIPLALQRVFWMLHQDNDAADTRELTKAFGWDSFDSFLQHDVQELARVLSDNLEEKMKNTEVEGTMSYLFEGKIKNYIKCVNIDFESTREEPFYDLQLNVVNCKDVYDSFRKYIETEMLEGDNKYQAEGHGLQDAKKGCIFRKFPPVLMLHLKRFEYDFIRDLMYKVNDRYEFYDEINLKEFAEPEEGQSDEDYIFRLFSVLVHSGDVSGGHYYAFIRPNPRDNQWYKFDDEHVYKVSQDNALEDNFGGDPQNLKFPFMRRAALYKRFSNAYMLIYIRKKDIETILTPVTEDEIPDLVRERFAEERKEEERILKEKAEAHRYSLLSIVRDENLKFHHETEICDFKNVEQIRVLKTEKFGNLKRKVSETTNIPMDNIRFWKFELRENNTYRPQAPLSDDYTVHEELKPDDSQAHIYMEISGEKLRPLSRNSLLLFIKQYDFKQRQLNYLGNIVVENYITSEELKEEICERVLQVDPETDLFMVEEVAPNSLESFTPGATLAQKEMLVGDIVVVQYPPSNQEAEQIPFPFIEDYYQYLVNRIMIRFIKLDDMENQDSQFVLEMLQNMKFSEVVEVVGKHLGVDPQYIRLTGNALPQKPRSIPFKSTDQINLRQMLTCVDKITNVLYYEILSVPIDEIERKTSVTVSFFNQKVQEEKKFDLLLERGSSIGDLFEEVKKHVNLETEHKKLRLLQVYNGRLHKRLAEDTTVDYIGKSGCRIEEVSDEEFDVGKDDAVILVHHFNKSVRGASGINIFGNPFYFVVHAGETLQDIKPRIQQKLDIPDKEFEKWKFSIISMLKAYPLEDDSVILDELDARKKYGSEPHLGLEHRDHSSKSSDRWFNKPIVIRN